MLEIVHDGVANQNHFRLQLALIIALLSTLPKARKSGIPQLQIHMKELCQLVIVHRDTETDYGHDKITHILSIRHLNDSRFYSISFLLNVLTLKISTQRCQIN